jgi:hypothetical protein
VQWEKLEDRLRKHKLTMMYRISKHKSPDTITALLLNSVPHYLTGERPVQILHARIRLAFSDLKQHLFRLFGLG